MYMLKIIIRLIQVALCFGFFYGLYCLSQNAKKQNEALESEKNSYPIVLYYDEGLFDKKMYLDSIREEGDQTHCYQKNDHIIVRTERIKYIVLQ